MQRAGTLQQRCQINMGSQNRFKECHGQRADTNGMFTCSRIRVLVSSGK